MSDDINTALTRFCEGMGLHNPDDPPTFIDSVKSLNSLLEFTIFVDIDLWKIKPDGKLDQKVESKLARKAERINHPNGDFLITVYKARRYCLVGRVVTVFKKTRHAMAMARALFKAWRFGHL